MRNDRRDADLRLEATRAGKSVPARASAAVTRQLPVIGLVVLRVAGDQRLQALAVGRLDAPPVVDVLLDPYRPQDADFAAASAHLTSLLRQDSYQLWIPDPASLRACGLDGDRNRRNPVVPRHRQELARISHAVFHLADRPGQQVMVVATNLLSRHLVTGQYPTEDAHLWARLAWDDPQPGRDPGEVSETRRERAGPSLLPFEDDEQVEAIRARAFRGLATQAELTTAKNILEAGVLHSWQILVEAYTVYTNLPIPDVPGLQPLIQQSARDFSWHLQFSPAFGANRQMTLREFRAREYLHDVTEDINARGDPMERERLRQEGRVIRATVLKTPPSKRRPKSPCRLLLSTTQDTRRFRVGTRLKSGDGRIEGKIEIIRYTPSAVFFSLDITKGVRTVNKLHRGSEQDWFDTVVFPVAPWMARKSRHATC